MSDENNMSLSGCVEVDGEAVCNSAQIVHKYNTSLKSLGVKTHHSDNVIDSSIDSGIDSMGNVSLRSNPSLEVEKTPIQCSDVSNINVRRVRDTAIAAVTEKLSKLSTDTEDEGIYSMPDSVTSETNLNEQIIEIDLYETDSDGDTLLHMAVISKKHSLINVFVALLEDTACLNIQNELFQSPLHLAVLTYQPEVATCLVTKGCNVMLRDKQGNTALHIACRNGDFDIVQTIVESLGSDMKRRQKLFAIRNCQGITCLHLASQNKQYTCMGYLFAKGADVNIGDSKSGRTILHYAAERKDLETVSRLLTHADLDVDTRTYNGETALVLAFWRNYQDIVRTLRKKGASFSYDMFEDSDDDVGS